MADYAVRITRSARKEVEALDPPLLQRLFLHLEAFAHTPRPAGCRKLQGDDGLWRIRVGEYRVVYAIDDAQRVVDIIAVRHRRDVYQ